MRPESLRNWRSRGKLAIVVGLGVLLVLGGYALFELMLDGLHWCHESSGCEDQVAADNAHYHGLLNIALIGGGALIVGGIAMVRSLGKRLRQLEAVPFATVVERPESGPKVS